MCSFFDQIINIPHTRTPTMLINKNLTHTKNAPKTFRNISFRNTKIFHFPIYEVLEGTSPL